MNANTDEVSPKIENQSSLEEAMQRGKAASEAGDKEGAYAIFKQVTEEHPDALDPWVWLGWSCSGTDEAEAAFKRALEIDPTSEEAARGMEWVASERGAESALSTEPTEPAEVSQALADEEVVVGELTSEPLDTGGPLPQTEEGSGETYSLDDLMQLGIATAQAGDKVTAHITFQSVVDRYPDVPEAWVWLAGTTTNLEEAEHAFQTAANLDPTNEEARLGLRWVALRKSGSSASTMTRGTANVTSQNVKPYDTGALAPRDVPAEEASPTATAQFLKQPAFILGIVIALVLLIAVLLVVAGVI